jgi:hypothetical protein
MDQHTWSSRDVDGEDRECRLAKPNAITLEPVESTTKPMLMQQFELFWLGKSQSSGGSGSSACVMPCTIVSRSLR